MNKLKELIRRVLAEMQEEDSVEEVSSSGAAGPYQTPFAFSKNGKGNIKAATQLGMKLVNTVDEKKQAAPAAAPAKPTKELPINRKDLKFIKTRKAKAKAIRDPEGMAHLDRLEKFTKQKLRISELTDAAVKTPLDQFNMKYSSGTVNLIKNLIASLNNPSTGIVGKDVHIDARKNNPNTPTTFPYEVKISSVGFKKVKSKLFLVLFETDASKVNEYYIEIGTSLVNAIQGNAKPEAPAPTPEAPAPEAPAANGQNPAKNQQIDPKLSGELNK